MVFPTRWFSAAAAALVRPILEYSQTVWDPYTSSETQQLESVQRRAARFTLNRYRRASMLAELNWEHEGHGAQAQRYILRLRLLNASRSTE